MNQKSLRQAIAGLLALILFEVARVYFIMPFPGSQQDGTTNSNQVSVAYWLHQNGGWLRTAGVLLVAYPIVRLLIQPVQRWHRLLVGVLVLMYCGVLYGVNHEMMADQMFRQPTTKRMVRMAQNKIPANKLVLGVVENGEARAYPIQLIGYHHQVRDTVGGKPVMITYCTVCRTGRVFDPVVNGKPETFRLVGMDHFNAMFEDERAGSWWRQATGEAILGPRTGETLTELSGSQMTLAEWAAEHPNTLVMQPDPAFKTETDSLATYDLGTKRSQLTGRDSASWQRKSWVIGVVAGKSAKAFDWMALTRKRVINNAVGPQPVVVYLLPDQLSFHVWSRRVADKTLTFMAAPDGTLSDRETGTVWSGQGLAVSGPLTGQRLTPVRAYQEFWHSWQSFHPETNR